MSEIKNLEPKLVWGLFDEITKVPRPSKREEKIGKYLDENKAYLCSVISRLEDKEFNRIRYLSVILKNKLGDFKPKAAEAPKPKVQVDESFYVPTTSVTRNKRRSLEDLEDEF